MYKRHHVRVMLEWERTSVGLIVVLSPNSGADGASFAVEL